MSKYKVLSNSYLKSECGQFFSTQGIEKLIDDKRLMSVFNIDTLKIQCLNDRKKIVYKEVLSLNKYNKKCKILNIKTELGKNEDFINDKFLSVNGFEKVKENSYLCLPTKSNFGTFNAGDFIPQIVSCGFSSRFCVYKNTSKADEITELALNKLGEYLLMSKSGKIDDIDYCGDYKISSLDDVNITINIGLPLIFSWKYDSLRSFMSHLYSICGQYYIEKNEDGNLYSLSIALKDSAVSDRIIDILSKFEIMSCKKIYKKISTNEILYKVEINSNYEVLNFLSKIGFACEKQIELIKIIAQEKREFNNYKFVPEEYWNTINKNNNINYDFSEINEQEISTETLREISDILDCDEINIMANAEIIFDKIININYYESDDNVYSIEIEDGFSPVINGVCI